MKILTVGKGGREHAIAKALSRSSLCDALYCAPGNPGMAEFAECVNISDADIPALVEFAKDNAIDLTVVGPESALADGIADAFEAAGLKIFAPSQAAAQVESSKDFAKQLMEKYAIPTAAYQTFEALEPALAYVREKGAPIVIKEDGLKAGKGVTVAMSLEEAENALEDAFKDGENRVVIEEYLEGFEFSLICLVHGETVVPLEVAQDHKAVGDGDTGPNTGGMGSYSPVRRITPEITETALETIIRPMARALKEEGVPFTGFLYGGLMETKDGIKTIEFNARFGDPEAEVILCRLESDFVKAILDVMEDKEPALEWSNKVSHGVVLASEGYPASSTKGALIEGLENVKADVYHMGTRMSEDGLVTDGGRVLMVVTMEDTLEDAFAHTYGELENVQCDKLFWRHDIGRKDME